MSELTLKLDFCDWIGYGLDNYLLTLDGIVDVKVDTSNDEVYIKYDNSIISSNILSKEIQLYLSKISNPFILAFDKHDDNDTEKYTICIKDLCCEYCLMGAIEDLMLKDGIVNAYTNFDFHNKKNVKIYIKYKKTISREEILRLEETMNS